MIEIFENLSRLYGNDGYYEIFFEYPDEKPGMPEFERITSVFFGFAYLKILDVVLKPTKEKVLKEFESNPNQDFFNIATYDDGKSIGFYNTSDLDIEKIYKRNNHKDALIEYVDGFSDNVKEIFKMINFKANIEFLVKYKVLDDFLDEICKDEENKSFSYDELITVFHDLIDFMKEDPYYEMGYENIFNNDPFSSYYYINESVDKLGDLLNSLLLNDVDLKNKDTYKIYDPNSIGAYILHKAKYDILSKNLNSNITLYGKSERNENEIIRHAKNTITKKDSYEIEDVTIIEPNQSILKTAMLTDYDDFDFIITNYIGCKYNEVKRITGTLKNQNAKDVKAVFALDTLSEVYNYLNKLVENDYLELLVRFKSYFIIIINTNKNESKKGKFLYINECGLQDEKPLFSNNDRFANSSFNLFYKMQNKVNEDDLEQMNRVLKSYEQFNNSVNSKTVKNSEYESVRKLFYN